MNRDEFRRYKAPLPPPGAREHSHNGKSYSSSLCRGITKAVQYKLLSFRLVLSPFIAIHDPFEQMTMTMAAVAAKDFRRRQGQGGARRVMPPFSLFWICRNDRSGCKSETVLQRNDYVNPDIKLESDFQPWTWTNWWNRSEFPFCSGSKGSKWTLNERYKIYEGCPLNAAFTTLAEAFLQHSRNFLVGISTYFRGQANKVVA